MRTNIVIDDQLMAEARAATGLKINREAVELGLRTLIRLNRQAEIRNYRGKLPSAVSLVGPNPQP
ncbi:type II toxin-antitoxin system VapB family antitoxin [uncultured Brevundimonas sp.]|uniref:type II toxin-antitoxin system VapB family antitoxin n=1 Tax=uncultured Brevundimonas sp. TaxID=213418 RepID=UPI0030EE0922|tara:strand:- start:83978 stop:84172 length:195 start_codon:yes stop_codon:yes gene_type:complete